MSSKKSIPLIGHILGRPLISNAVSAVGEPAEFFVTGGLEPPRFDPEVASQLFWELLLCKE